MTSSESTALAVMRDEDFDEVTDLWRRTNGVGLRPDETRAWFQRYLARNPGTSWIVRRGPRLVGAVLCGHDGRRGYLYHLAVADDERRQGIGRSLVNAALASLAKETITRATIFVFADNEAGKSFWASQSWQERLDLRVIQKTLE